MAIAVIMTVIMSDDSVLQVCLQLLVRGVYIYCSIEYVQKSDECGLQSYKARAAQFGYFRARLCRLAGKQSAIKCEKERERDADTHTDTHKYLSGVQYSERKRDRE